MNSDDVDLGAKNLAQEQEMEAIVEEAEQTLSVATLDKMRSNPVAYDRFLVSANGLPFWRATSVKGGIKLPSDEDVLHWLADAQCKYQDMFYKDAQKYVTPRQLEKFFDCVRSAWLDGKSKRLKSDAMRSVYAAIREYYDENAPNTVRSHLMSMVQEASSVEPLLTGAQIGGLMQATHQVLHPFTEDYIENANFTELVTASDIWVHRGINVPGPLADGFYNEKTSLSSYSLALSIAEQFSQTGAGLRANVSARLSHVWERVLIFTPFIPDVEGPQYELVLLSTASRVPVKDQGEHAGVHEYELILDGYQPVNNE